MSFAGFRYESVWSYVFAFALITAVLAETFRPFRVLPTSTARRWISNGALLAVCVVVGRGAYQLSGIALAVNVHAARYGVLNRIALPFAARLLIGIGVLDLTHYVVHRLLHAFHALWRVHRVHHSETDLDATTGLRFHPAEALIAQGAPLLIIALFGVPVIAVLTEGLIVVLQDFFTHANIDLPSRLDGFLRTLIITPGMHRTHHSEAVVEQNTNFGTIFSIWDRLFGTYLTAPAAGVQVRCGVMEFAHGSNLHAVDLLLLPFRGSAPAFPRAQKGLDIAIAQPVRIAGLSGNEIPTGRGNVKVGIVRGAEPSIENTR